MSAPREFLQIFVPAICKPSADGTPAAFEGSITLRRPTYAERNSLMEPLTGNVEDEIDAAIAEAENAPLDGGKPAPGAAPKKRSKASGGKLINHLIAQLPLYVKAVSIKHIESGYVYDGVDALEIDTEMHVTLMEIATQLIQKFTLGKTN